MHFAVELQGFVCDRTPPPTIEKLRSKGVAIYARVWHFCILNIYRKSIKWTWVEPFEMNVKIARGLNFDLDNESRHFFDAKEA